MHLTQLLSISLFFFLLTSCGGGSSEPTPTPPEVTPPAGGDTGDGGENSGGDTDNPDGDSASGDGNEGDNASGEPSSQPNILLIISDDQGLDASNQYALSTDLPSTPNIDQLANTGITFDNMWATPACSTTRATIITGKYGHNSGVESVPGNLSSEHEIIQKYLKNNTATSNYKSAVFGKWHIGVGSSSTHPNDVGLDHYAGNLTNISDYYDWSLTTNGVSETSTDYHSTKITDLSIDWINQQTSPWFAWVAYSAPHSPYHLPPSGLHNRDLSGTDDDINNNKRDYYLAAIEAMDAEIGRLLNALPEETRSNTVVLFIGDNGTPRNVIDETIYPRSHSKGTLYQGGVAVPFVVSGKGITRKNQREGALVTATDLYATIAELAGVPSSKTHDSQSFKGLFEDVNSNTKNQIYTAYQSANVAGWTVRSDNYKLVEFEDGSQELYSLTNNFAETDNLLPSNDSQVLSAQQNLANVAALITGEDITQNDSLDITNAILTSKSENCADYVERYTSTVSDINKGTIFYGDLKIAIIEDKCIFQTNAIPNHDFNDGGNAFPNDVSAQNDQFEVTTTPSHGTQTVNLSLRVDNAIMLNGVKVDLLAAGCFGIGNGKVGCGDMSTPWRYDPMHAANGFNVDSHNAHAQPDGTYHYHGSPMALFSDDNGQESPVVGFAADGYPIFGSYFDDQGTIRKATSSYRLIAGNRPSGDGQPGGTYDGAFRDDYEYVQDLGDLDECNGMTIDGVYGYYITDTYPYVLACFKGIPDTSFTK